VLICESDESADELSELRSSDDDDSDYDDFYGMIFSVP
jgi:nucleosome binding factor SPN SPT16 subunit